MEPRAGFLLAALDRLWSGQQIRLACPQCPDPRPDSEQLLAP